LEVGLIQRKLYLGMLSRKKLKIKGKNTNLKAARAKKDVISL
jgi:hypothetical protein